MREDRRPAARDDTVAHAVSADRIAFLDLGFDRLTLDGTLDWVTASIARRTFAYVVTPNVDHMVRLPKLEPALQAVYTDADLCLCDSRILARLAGTCGIDLPVVPGSDLTATLLGSRLAKGTRLLLVGGDADAATLLRARYPDLDILHDAPPMGLRHDAAARAAVIDTAVAADPQLILLAVGSPQQELLAWEMKASGRLRATTLCIGASVDFLVGREKRAPKLVQKAGLEWAWRLLQNPRRLARRYLIDDPAIFAMTWAWARRRRSKP